MKSAWKIVALVACVALICAAGYLLWKRANERRAAAAFAACRVKAEQGDAKSQYELGRMYFYGFGVPKNPAIWAEWCRKAAEQGNARAETQLGNTYYYGWGVDRDFDRALFWYHKAADQGEPEALKDIGYSYSNGNGVAKDYVEAVRWYRLSADKGYASGEANLGDMYLYGFGVQQNMAEARRWFLKAADHGNAYAQEMLGRRELRPGYLIKTAMAVELIGSLLLLFGGLGNVFLGKSQSWDLGHIAGLLGLFYVAIDIYSRSSLAVFRSPIPLDLIATVRGAAAVAFAMAALALVLPRRQWRGIARLLLLVASIFFLILNGSAVWLLLHRGFLVDNPENLVRHCCSFNMQLLALATVTIIVIRREKGKIYVDGAKESDESEELKAKS